MPFMAYSMENKKPEVKRIFIEKSLEDKVREFVKKPEERLERKDYIAYFHESNKELLDIIKYQIRFMATYRGVSYEVLSEENLKNKKDSDDKDIA